MNKFCLSTCIAASLLLPTHFSMAAEQLTSQQAELLKPYKEITLRGQYYSILEYERAVKSAAERAGAASYYISNIQLFAANDRMRIIYVNLYDDNPEKVTPSVKDEVTYKSHDGVYEYDKAYAQTHEHFKLIRVRGYFTNVFTLTYEVAKKAKQNGAYGFYVYNISEIGSNKEATVFLYHKDAPVIATPKIDDSTPLISTVSDSATSATNTAATAVTSTTSTVSTTSAPSQVPVEKEVVRYTVTLPDDVKIQELNHEDALKMKPFKTVKVRGYFVTPIEMSRAAAKKAADNNAKYYYIARVSPDLNGPNKTIYIELYN